MCFAFMVLFASAPNCVDLPLLLENKKRKPTESFHHSKSEDKARKKSICASEERESATCASIFDLVLFFSCGRQHMFFLFQSSRRRREGLLLALTRTSYVQVFQLSREEDEVPVARFLFPRREKKRELLMNGPFLCTFLIVFFSISLAFSFSPSLFVFYLSLCDTATASSTLRMSLTAHDNQTAVKERTVRETRTFITQHPFLSHLSRAFQARCTSRLVFKTVLICPKLLSPVSLPSVVFL